MTDTAATTTSLPRPALARWGLKIAVALVVALVANLVLLVREAQSGDGDRLERLKSLERRANPLLLRFAGSGLGDLSRLDHRGRRSGQHYSTPLLAERAGGGFLMAMPYGPRSDWARNLVAAGEGTLHHNGAQYRLHNPRIVPASDARRAMPRTLRFLTWLLGIQHVMRVDAGPPRSGSPPNPA